MPDIQDPRGSLWHRWDPHIHAPGTLLNDQFGGNWETYFKKIETSEPRIEALGVTDYFGVGTYKEVRKQKAAGRLKDVNFLFPNVELRIETKTAAQRAINIHLLFSSSDPKHEAEIERILGQLTFDAGERQYACTRSDLIALGQTYDPRQRDEGAALKAGANQFKTTLRDLKNRFKAERWLRENCLVALQCKSGDGASGLQDDDAFAIMRKELQAFADIMFTSRPKDRSFWLGEQPGFDRDFIETNYRNLKPCLHGSDAHSEDDTGVPAQDRFCWLKGDLSFETLRQAVVEPGDRVTIGAEPPPQAIPALTIKHVSFVNANWMKEDAIELNGGLVAIIGARGSGKTALADIIAMGAYAADSGRGEASFLKRASSPVDHLGSAVVKLTWADDTTTGRPMKPGFITEESEFVRYLSQHFVEKLCSSAGLATELRSAMERVVFDSMDPLERLEADTFEELSARLLEPIRANYASLQRQIDEIGDVIVQDEILRDGLQKMIQDRELLVKKIDSAKKEQQKLIPKGNEDRVKRLVALETACTGAQSKVEGLGLSLRIVEDLRNAAVSLVGTTETTRFLSMQQKYAQAKLTPEEWGAFKLRFTGDTAAAIAAAKARAERAKKIAIEGDPAIEIDIAATPLTQWPLNLIKSERDNLKAAVGIDAEQKRKYDDAQKIIAGDELLLTRLDAQIEYARGAEGRRTANIDLRRLLYLQVFEQLVTEEQVLGNLYAPLKERLVGAKGALSKLAFVTERALENSTAGASREKSNSICAPVIVFVVGAASRDLQNNFL